ncbi:hypothetical protein BGZ61DRAFT_469839 [Ilyonectria robusta]|uniref:uncharacterized protein n=1 Tax=Ilyonectria robusta TaxID=1079257 RepID=UPI001E8E885E|nr:uncharacterized protein BGZ61DRAFT_469839 [Ilyonectria robusta]KAH8648097.1 hypothetical protein BGZ61DRAFT_469839 [Ilyonectria robusta]
MSLPSPLSVGDAILLAKIAYNVVQAFSSGAKSAPAEFAEVQRLLVSVKHSLDLLAKMLPQDPEKAAPGGCPTEATWSDEMYTALADIRENCGAVLNDLDQFVKKYMILDKNAAGKNERRWGDQMKRSWKKVSWATEGDNIDKMRGKLTDQVNALNLFIVTMRGDQQTAIHGKVETIHTKLHEIHEWFTENLKKERDSASSAMQPSQAEETSAEPSGLEFVLYEQLTTPSGQQKVLICPHATFEDPDPSPGGNANRHYPSRIFRCLCSSLNSGSETMTARDHSSQRAHTMLPVSLFVQSIHSPPDNRFSWQIYVYSPLSNSPVSLLLEQVPPLFLAKFEGWVNKLRVFQAATHIAHNLDTALVLHKDDSVSILNMKSDVSYFGGSVPVRFIANGTSFLVKQPSSLQLLHYASSLRDFLDPDLDFGSALIDFAPEPYLNIQIVSNHRVGLAEEQRYSVQLHHDTPVTSFKGPRFVTLQGCLCTHVSGQPSQNSESLNCSEVEFEFLDASMAYEYIENPKAIKRSLHLYYLQRPRWGEQVVYQRDVGDVMIRSLVLSDAKLTIIVDPSTGRYREILSRSDHSASVCFELPPDFLAEVAMGTTSMRPNQAAWFVEMGKDGVRIEKQDCGIDLLCLLRQDMHQALRPS